MKAFSIFLALILTVLAMSSVQAVQKSPGCGKAAGLSNGVYTVNVNGKQRQYLMRVPQNYNPNTAYRLIFTFHWRGGDMYAAANNAGGWYGLAALAHESTIFVSPNGLNQGWANNGGEDIALVDAIVKNIDEKLCVDQTLRFATGFSFGGGMSHSVACSRAGVFRGVSVIAGATLSGCAGGNTPIAYQSIHGVSDNVLPISLGRELRDRYIRVNGCQNQNAQEPRQGSGTHIKTEYKGCRAGYPVTYIAHDGGHVAEPADRGQGNFAPQATWSFFSQFN